MSDEAREKYERYMALKAGVLEYDQIMEAVLPAQLGDQFPRMHRTYDRVYYVCPCGGVDHFAARYFLPDSTELSPVLNCYETGMQWMVKPIPIAEIIRAEEESYFRLLDKAEKLVPKIIKKRGYSSETLAFLKDTHGLPEEVSEDIWKMQTASREEKRKP